MYRRHTVAIVGTVLVLAGCSSTTDLADESALPTTESATTTALLVSTLHPPAGLLGSDGKQHVEYDLVFTNVFGSPVTLTGIDVRTPDGTTVLTMNRDQIAATTQPVFGGPASAEIAASGAVGTVIDLVVPPDKIPDRLQHRIRYEMPGHAPLSSVIGAREFDGPELAVDKQSATVIASPVRGAGWWNANSCCVASTPHRFSRLAVGGASVKKFEEFAIDWVQMRNGRFFDGDGKTAEQWYGYGSEIHAVADGEVASVRSGYPNQIPNEPATGLQKPEDYSGNVVSVQIGPNIWAIYAHLQPGSITVKPGDKVTAGQVLGKMGNTGNSSAPHLHFQLSDGPEATNSTSLPFVIDSYVRIGSIDPAELAALDEDPTTGAPAAIEVRGPAQPQTRTYPLAFSVTDFGG